MDNKEYEEQSVEKETEKILIDPVENQASSADDAFENEVIPQEIPEPNLPFYKNKRFWKRAIPGALLILFMLKGYWGFLAFLSVCAIFVSIVGIIISLVKKSKKWIGWLITIAVSVVIFFVWASKVPLPDTHVSSPGSATNQNSISNQQPAVSVQAVLPSDVSTGDLLPSSANGYKVIKREVAQPNTQFPSAAEVSYMQLQPTTDNSFNRSIAEVQVYMVKFAAAQGKSDDLAHSYRTSSSTVQSTGEDGTPRQAVTRSESFACLEHNLGLYHYEIRIIMNQGVDAKQVNDFGLYSPLVIGYIEKVISLNPSYVKGYAIAASLYYDLRNPDQTMKMAEKGLAIDPQNAELYNYRGLAKAAGKDNRGAADDYTQAINLKPEKAYYFNRGVSFIQIQEFDKAISDLNKYIEQDAKNAEAFNWRGVAYYRLGKKDEAIADFNQALSIRPNFDAAQQNLKSLE
ncbi:MAG: tetratricopeptide repeat protein [Syntrophomonas sp.]